MADIKDIRRLVKNKQTAEYFARNKDRLLRNQVIERIKTGSIPWYSVAKKYNLVDEVNPIRKAAGLPEIEHLYSEHIAAENKLKQRQQEAPPKKEQKKAPSSNIVTLQTINKEINEAENLSASSKKNYISKLRKLSEIFKCGDDIVKCLKDPKESKRMINEFYSNNNTRKDMISAIKSAAKVSESLRKGIGAEALAEYASDIQDAIKVANVDNDAKTEQKAIPWKTFTDIADKLQKDKPDSIEAILARLYTEIPPMRNNFGEVKIIQDANEDDGEGNFYVQPTGTLIINDFKTKKTYDSIEAKLPKSLKSSIDKSLKAKPRKYLIVQQNGLPYSNLSAIISRIFGAGINSLRHSYISYQLIDLKKMSVREREKLAKAMGHSTSMQLKYLRTGSSKDDL